MLFVYLFMYNCTGKMYIILFGRKKPLRTSVWDGGKNQTPNPFQDLLLTASFYENLTKYA